MIKCLHRQYIINAVYLFGPPSYDDLFVKEGNESYSLDSTSPCLCNKLRPETTFLWIHLFSKFQGIYYCCFLFWIYKYKQMFYFLGKGFTPRLQSYMECFDIPQKYINLCISMTCWYIYLFFILILNYSLKKILQ